MVFATGVLALQVAAFAQLNVASNAVPTAAEATVFGAEYEAAFHKGDAKAMLARLDFQRIGERALVGLPGDEAARRTFAIEFAKGAAPSYEFALRGFSQFKFLRAIPTNGQQVAVFRILLPDGSMNYHRYLLRRATDGAEVSDGHSLASGEWFSDTIRRMYVLSESKRDPGFAAGLTGANADLARNSVPFEKAVALMQREKTVEFLDAYKLLPLSLREDRFLLQLRIAAALEVEPVELGLALKDWARLYPDDPGPELLAFGKLVNRGENFRAIAALGRLEAGIGGDLHLQALRASLVAKDGEVTRARAMAEAVMRAEPNLPSAHDAMIAVAVARRDFGEIARCLDNAATALGKDPLPIVTEERRFAAFRESPEGRAWLQKRGH